jgi:predicted membrane protein
MYNQLLLELKIYVSVALSYIIMSLAFWLDGINNIAKVITAILAVLIAVYTVMKIKTDIKNKKIQQNVLKLQELFEQERLRKFKQNGNDYDTTIDSSNITSTNNTTETKR